MSGTWELGGEDYTGELSAVASRRLLREQAALSRGEGLLLQKLGIFHHFSEAEPHKAVALIVGPDETPYARGFYLFEFVFPNSYPLKPPQASFRTGDGRVRFNPNLYRNGKVCLSILGTWEGPSWTSLTTFRSVLLSIQSLLSSRPLQNEPGHEQDVGSDCELYSAMLRYENVAVAALQLAQPLPPVFEPLRSRMAGLFLHNYSFYVRSLDEFMNCEGSFDRCPLFNFFTRYAPSRVRAQLLELQQTLLQDGDEAGQEARRIAEELRLEDPPSEREVLGMVAAQRGSALEAAAPRALAPTAAVGGHVARGLCPGVSGWARCLRRLCLATLIATASGAAAALLVPLLPVPRASSSSSRAVSSERLRRPAWTTEEHTHI